MMRITRLGLAAAAAVVLLLLAGCATGGNGTVSRSGSPREELAAAIASAELGALPEPLGAALPLTDTLVANGLSLAAPAGWRFRTGEFAATPEADLEFESADGQLSGAIEFYPTDADAVEVARTLILTELWQRQDARVSITAESPLLFTSVHTRRDGGQTATIIAEHDEGILVLGARIRSVESSVATLLAIAASVSPTEVGRFERETAAGAFRVSATLQVFEWLGDVDGGGMVLSGDDGALLLLSRLDPRTLPELAAVTEPVADQEATPPNAGVDDPGQWEALGVTSGWLGGRFDLYRRRGEAPVWLLARRMEPPAADARIEISTLAAALASSAAQTTTAAEAATPDTAGPQILNRSPVAAILPPVVGEEGPVAEQIANLLGASIDTALRVTPDIEVADTRGTAAAILPADPLLRRRELVGRTARFSPQWVIATEILAPEEATASDGTLPVVRVTVLDTSSQEPTTVERQLETVFDVFPLIDEVSLLVIRELGSQAAAFGELVIEAPEGVQGLTVEVNGRLLPPGRLRYEPFPAGTWQVRVLQASRSGRQVLVDREVSVVEGDRVTVAVPVEIPNADDEELASIGREARAAIDAGNNSALARAQLRALIAIGALPVEGTLKRRIYAEVIPPGEGEQIRSVSRRLATRQLVADLATLPGGGAPVTFAGLLETYLTDNYYTGWHYPTLPAGVVTVDGAPEPGMILPPLRASLRPDAFWGSTQGRIPQSLTIYQDEEFRYLVFDWAGAAPRSLRWYIISGTFGGGQGIAFRGAGETPIRTVQLTNTGGRNWGEERIIVGDPVAGAEVAKVAFDNSSMEVALPRSITSNTELYLYFYGAATGSGEIRRPADVQQPWRW